MSAGFFFILAWVFVVLALLSKGQVDIHATLARIEQRQVREALRAWERGDL